MGMKKKLLSAALCAAMVGAMAAPATVQAEEGGTLVYCGVGVHRAPGTGDPGSC